MLDYEFEDGSYILFAPGLTPVCCPQSWPWVTRVAVQKGAPFHAPLE